ncbi:MAG: cysK, partial [Belnapia sp.]|nr:cysK [Belnapia sp.]
MPDGAPSRSRRAPLRRAEPDPVLPVAMPPAGSQRTTAQKTGGQETGGQETAPLPPRGRIYGSVLELIGATPLVRLPRLKAADGLVADLAIKLEFFNPLG